MFIILNKGHEDTLYRWIQQPLRELFSNVPSEYHVPGYDGPQRSGSNNNTTIVGGYAVVLLQSITPVSIHSTEYNTNHQRPNKQHVINLLDEQDFPTLHPTTGPQPSLTRNPSPHHIPIQPSQASTYDTPRKLNQELDEKVASLQQLLQTQIDAKMDTLTSKFEAQFNTTINRKFTALETQVNQTLDQKLDTFLSKLTTILPLQHTLPTSSTPAHNHQKLPKPPNEPELPTVAPTHSPGKDPLMTQEIIAVGNDQSSNGMLI